jgi:nucleotide-binding universal stress UspA family protein
MIRKILVCLEGSPSGGRAVDLAIEIAQQLGASLAGLAIVEEPDIRAGAATSIGGVSYKKQRDEALVQDARQRVDRWLGEFTQRCRSCGIRADAVEQRGRPAATILEEMQHHDLALMGRHANFKFEIVASDPRTRDVVLQQARKPVLVVPEDPPVDSSRVLAAFDGSSAAMRALHSFAGSGLAARNEVSVASVEDDGAAAWEMASRGVEILRGLGVEASPRNLVSTLAIADALLQERARLGARMMVMGAYARSRLTELVWGSITRALLDKTPVPLYLHH